MESFIESLVWKQCVELRTGLSLLHFIHTCMYMHTLECMYIRMPSAGCQPFHFISLVSSPFHFFPPISPCSAYTLFLASSLHISAYPFLCTYAHSSHLVRVHDNTCQQVSVLFVLHGKWNQNGKENAIQIAVKQYPKQR